MAMTRCRECGHEISTTARSCPSCGGKVPRTKWWLWVPLGLVAAFLGYGALIPENEAQANSVRRTCEKEMMPRGLATQYDCDRAYDAARAKKHPKCPDGHQDCSWGR